MLGKVCFTNRIEKNQFPQEIIKNAQTLFDTVLNETSNSIYGAPLKDSYHPIAMITGYKLMLDFMIDNKILEMIHPETSYKNITRKIHYRVSEYKEFVQTLYYNRELNENCIKLTKEIRGLFQKIYNDGKCATYMEPSEYTFEM